MPDHFADGLQRTAQIDRDEFRRELFVRRRGAPRSLAASARRRQSRWRALIATALSTSQRCALTFARIFSSRPASPSSVRAGNAQRIAIFPIGMLRQIALVQEQQLCALRGLASRNASGLAPSRVDEMKDQIGLGAASVLGAGDPFLLDRVAPPWRAAPPYR